MILVFMYGKKQESGLTEITPLIYILTISGQYPVFLHPENLKVENYLLFGDITENYVARDTTSQIALRLCSKEVREQPEYTGVFAKGKKKMQRNIKRFLITKTESQTNDFSVFLCMGRSKSLGLLKLLL